MKNAIAISSVLFVVVLLTGCSQQQTSQTQPLTPAPVVQQLNVSNTFSSSSSSSTENKAQPTGTTSDTQQLENEKTVATTKTINVNYNGITFNAIIDNPGSKEVDVLLAFHGTVMDDTKSIEVAGKFIEKIKKIIKKENIMIISVAYPEEGLLMGDNLRESEAALLWTKNNASKELGVKIDKIYLIGHSQGGYIVTRLNTMHKTDGVIANGTGPINLAFHCTLVEKGKIGGDENSPQKETCNLLKKAYGSVLTNPAPYIQRSLIGFTTGYKSKIIFIQGMEDSKIQMTVWPKFKEKVGKCTNCAKCEFLELEGSGHQAIFENDEAIKTVNNFISD